MTLKTKEFLDGLKKAGQGRRRVSKDIILKVFAETLPEAYYGRIDYTKLLQLLQALAEQRCIRLPSSKEYWDHTMKPTLPHWVIIRDTQKKRPKQGVRDIPWHPTLSWITTLTHLKQNTIADLIKLNAFFVSCGSQELRAIPIKERSLEIFGDEKRLDELINRSWFMKHITLEQLSCYKTIEPFAAKTSNRTHNHRTIIIENRDTFDSLWRSNEQLTPPPYNHVIYGHGKAIEDRILWIMEFDPEVLILEYFGDLDPEGINIPTRTNQKLIENDYPQRIKMALPFYLHLINTYITNHSFHFDKTIMPRSCLDFLPSKEKCFVEHLFLQKKRIPQEWLNQQEIFNILTNKQSS